MLVYNLKLASYNIDLLAIKEFYLSLFCFASLESMTFKTLQPSESV